MEKAVLWVLEAVVTPNYPRTAFFFNHLRPYPNTDGMMGLSASSFQTVEGNENNQKQCFHCRTENSISKKLKRSIMNQLKKTYFLLLIIPFFLSKEAETQEQPTEKSALYASASSTVYHYSYRLLKDCPMTRESFENTMAKGKLRRWRSTPMMQTYHKRYKKDDRCWQPVVFHAEWSINNKGEVFDYKTITKGSQSSHFNRTINGWIPWAIKSTTFPGFEDEKSICHGGLLLIYCKHYQSSKALITIIHTENKRK